MASRMNVLGAKAVLVNGRVRDIAELRDTGLPVRTMTTFKFVCLLGLDVAFDND